MAKYELLEGTHNGPGGGKTPSIMLVKVAGRPGPFVETDQNYEEMFPGKFRRVYSEQEREVHHPVSADLSSRPVVVSSEVDATTLPGVKAAGLPENKPETQDAMGENVTEKFDVAVANDLLVYHCDDGYAIFDGDKELVRGIKTIPQVKRKLKEHTEEVDHSDDDATKE